MKHEFVMNNQKYPVWLNQRGYACVTINEDGKDRAFLLHRLVWETENGPVPDGLELHYIDHDKANWNIGNLTAVDRKTHRAMHRQARSTDIDNKTGRDHKKATNPDHQRNNP